MTFTEAPKEIYAREFPTAMLPHVAGAPGTRRHTGSNRTNGDVPYPMATNVPAGRRETLRIASSVSAGMFPKKRFRDACAELYSIGDLRKPFTHREDAYTDSTARAMLPARKAPTLGVLFTRGNLPTTAKTRKLDRRAK